MLLSAAACLAVAFAQPEPPSIQLDNAGNLQCVTPRPKNSPSPLPSFHPTLHINDAQPDHAPPLLICHVCSGIVPHTVTATVGIAWTEPLPLSSRETVGPLFTAVNPNPGSGFEFPLSALNSCRSVNSTSTSSVFINGVDVVDEMAVLRQQVQALLDATALPTSSPTPVPRPTSSPTPTPWDHSGPLTADAAVLANVSYDRLANVLNGGLTIRNNDAITSFDGVFPNLRGIDRSLVIRDNEAATTLGAAFSNLLQLGRDPDSCQTTMRCTATLWISGNAELTTLGTAFGSLRRIFGAILFNGNPLLTNFDALRNLECHNGVYSNNPSTNCVNCPDWLINLPACPHPTGVLSGSLRVTDQPDGPWENPEVLRPLFYDSVRNITGHLDVHNVAVPVFLNLEVIEGDQQHYTSLDLVNVGPSLGAAFPNLSRIGVGADGASLSTRYAPSLTTLGTAFASLRVIQGTVAFEGCPLLADFEALRNIVCLGGFAGNNPGPAPAWLAQKPRCLPHAGQYPGDLIVNMAGEDTGSGINPYNHPAGLDTYSAYYDSIFNVPGYMSVQRASNGDTTTLGAALPNLVTIRKQMYIQQNEALTTLGSSFASLAWIGWRAQYGLHIVDNPVLATLGTAFASLRQIRGELDFRNNPLLTNFDTLRSLQCHGGPNTPRTNCVNCPDWLVNLPRCS